MPACGTRRRKRAVKKYILDSYALLCLFDRKRKTEAGKVRKYLEDADAGKAMLYLSKINEGEIFYKLYKYLGPSVAAGFRDDLRKKLFPVEVAAVNDKRAEKASEIKARYPVSYADAFCIGLAQEISPAIITGDPEFEAVRHLVDIVSLRPS